jgi:hypothetical protein
VQAPHPSAAALSNHPTAQAASHRRVGLHHQGQAGWELAALAEPGNIEHMHARQVEKVSTRAQ